METFSFLLSIPFNRRGYSYSLIKNCLTLYRWILPMPQICAYLWSSSQSLTKHSTNPDPNIPDEEIMVNSAHTWFSSLFDILLIITYVVFKGFGIREYAVNLYKSFILLLSPFKIGEYVGEHAILESKICPISHLPFSTERYFLGGVKCWLLGSVFPLELRGKSQEPAIVHLPSPFMANAR